MSDFTPEHAVLSAVLAAVRQAPDGQTEHALLGELKRRDVAPFAQACLSEPLELFRAHFLLFHCLYRLQEQLARQGEWLRIHCLDIGVRPLAACEDTVDDRGLAAGDPLRSYYLDLDNLDAMDAATVEAMLSGFWQRLNGSERRQEALRVLGMEEPAEPAAIRHRYRQLAQRHHPDKGGDTETLQQLNEAMMVLEREAP